jgi:hypothetical protein
MAMDEAPELSSITVSTADYGVMYCLGALRRWATRGVRDPERRPIDRALHWRPGHFEAVFYFPTPELEEVFLSKAKELLPATSWSWTKVPPDSAG